MARVYLIFRSTHETLKAEAVLQGVGLPCKVVMKPSAIHLDCGLAVRIHDEDQPRALSSLQASALKPHGIFTL